MPKAVAFTGSLHVCPMTTGPIPHVGGPVIGTGVLVLAGVMPAALIGDKAICVGPPDTVVLGSFTVLAMNKPMARMGDMCAHGGVIALGNPLMVVDG